MCKISQLSVLQPVVEVSATEPQKQETQTWKLTVNVQADMHQLVAYHDLTQNTFVMTRLI